MARNCGPSLSDFHHEKNNDIVRIHWIDGLLYFWLVFGINYFWFLIH